MDSGHHADALLASVRLSSAMSMTRSAPPSAASSCETSSSVFLSCRQTAMKIANTSSAVLASRLAHGSSASTNGGLLANARAMATLCCSPRESCAGLCARRSQRPNRVRRSPARRRRSRCGTTSANIIASITFSSALSAATRLKVWNTYPTFSARNRSRRASDRAKTSVPPTRMVPADGAVTPAIRLRSVVFPEPLRPRKTVQLPTERARCSRSSTSRARPPWSGNAFFTWCRRTADCSLIAIPRGTSSGGPQPSIGLQDGDRVDRHTDPTLQPERPDDKEKLICPILGQLVEVEDLDDVGTPVPDEVDVQRQAEKAERLPGVIGFYGETPFYRGVIGADRDDLHVVQELQAIGADTRLRLMPFGVRSVETPGIVRFRPRLPPPGPNQ